MRISSEEALLLAREFLVLTDSTDHPEDVPGQTPPSPGDGPDLPNFQGRYRITQLIGSGGMGDVYEAVQVNPRRRVAIKVVRAELVTGELIRRFEHEIRILGSLKHAGISQIYEAGQCSGGSIPGRAHADDRPTPFFAMEYVEGEPITRYATRGALGVNERLELLIKVCNAVAHAHQRGVIHRDLKPANIFVTQSADSPVGAGGVAEIKILDFGIARVTNADAMATSLHTETGKVIGTLSYMSPEQMFGPADELDTRSDVYSLGVIMYELLSGVLPYELTGGGAGRLAEAALAVRQGTPVSLSSINRAFRGDLETIVGKALEKDRDRRYQGVSELADDIRRFLNNEAITARKPSTWYELRKLMQRHRGVTVGSLTLVFVVAFSAGLTSWLWRMEALARGEADIARQAEAGARELSEHRARHATAVAAFLAEVLGAAHPSSGGVDVRVIDLLDEASAKLDERFREEPGQGAAVASALGYSYLGIGAFPKAEAMLRRAVKQWESSSDADAADVLKTRLDLANSIVLQNRAGEAHALLENIRADTIRLLGPDHGVARRALNDLSLAKLDSGDFQGAENMARAYLHAVMQDVDSRPKTRVRAEMNLASVLMARKLFDEAEDLLCRCFDNAREQLGEDDDVTLTVCNNYGSLLRNLGRPAEGERVLRVALGGRTRVLGETHPETLNCMLNLALALRDQKRVGEALALASRCYELRRAVHGPTAVPTLMCLFTIGMLHADMKDFESAEAALRESSEAVVARLGLQNKDSLNLLSSLGNFYRSRGRFQEADSAYILAVESAELLHGPRSCPYARMLLNRGECALRQHRYADAELMLLATEEIFSECGLADPKILARLHQHLRNLYTLTDRLDRAAYYHDRYLAGGGAPAGSSSKSESQ